MSSIPLPALDVKTPQQPDLLSKFGQLAQLKNMQMQAQMQQQEAPYRIQALQQQTQAGALGIQQQQMNIHSQQALMNSFSNLDPSDPNYFEKGIKAAQATGQVLPGQLQGIMAARMDLQNKAATLTKTQQEVLANRSDTLHSLGTQYLSLPDQDMAQNWPAIRQKVIDIHQGEQNFNPKSIPEQFPGRQWVQANTVISGMSAAGMRAAAAAQASQTGADRLSASMDPKSPLYAPSAASVALGTAPGAAQIQTGEAHLAGAKAASEAAARQPYEMALARQRQALSQGDPNAAAQLLVNRDATLSELKARGATPDFIAKALNAAHQLSGGKYNAQAADAEFQVAKSPENVAFFGSARSLTDPGGTLDQLATVAKSIPSNQIPAFNTIADWEKAATGNGPLAHYAATALGVADDYSKVMGGGHGSDTSRLQGLNLIKANAGPDGLGGAITGIRGAVVSQEKSRIGKNPVLQRMYGDEVSNSPAPAPTSHAFSIGAWHQANPNGDLNAAKAAAQQAGYQVVP